MTRSSSPQRIASAHDVWREQCINLQPSENATSPAVRRLLAGDMGNRYTLPIFANVHGSFVSNAYRGARHLDEVEALGERLARQVFHARHASLKPLSGHLAALWMLVATCRRGDLLLTVDARHGGYDGYGRGYMPQLLGLRVGYLPFDARRGKLRSEEAGRLIRRRRPRLVVVGASFFAFPYDLAPLREGCEAAGALLSYDASHVLGLIAGGEFQRPFQEGVDVVVGSTHKSFFGPQGGLLLTARRDLYDAAIQKFTWTLQDNAHWHRIAALTQALAEAKAFARPYARQVVRNARALGRALRDSGLPLRFAADGFTQSHQLLLDEAGLRREFGLTFNAFADRLERNDLIADAVGRIGVNEATRRGATEEDMESVADLILAAARGRRVREQVHQLRGRWQMAYVLPPGR